jgi:hypothetical protein
MTFPVEAEARRLERLHLQRSMRDALALVTTHKCQIGQHGPEFGGCGNTGVNCLCQCHDRPKA